MTAQAPDANRPRGRTPGCVECGQRAADVRRFVQRGHAAHAAGDKEEAQRCTTSAQLGFMLLRRHAVRQHGIPLPRAPWEEENDCD